MSSIQEKLQLKRVPLDTWNIREQLCLASSVARSGDQNWMSVSRALKTIGDPNRPVDWYSQKSCAAQYGTLLEHVETPKRKKRCSEGAVETPTESILKRLTQERIDEIQKNLIEISQQYETIKAEIAELRSPSTSDDRILQIWTDIETNKAKKERDAQRRAIWLRERDERKAKAEKTWRPTPPPLNISGPPSSPLLTSLLKSSPVTTTPQLMQHPASHVDTVSPSAGAPTLSMLLEKSATATTSATAIISTAAVASTTGPTNTNPDLKHAAIEQIKSQLQEIEHQLKASSSANASGSSSPIPPTAPAPAPAPVVDKIDIDDIEIKAEDVYAFSDIDLEIPPVSTIHKSNGSRSNEKQVFNTNKRESTETRPPCEDSSEIENAGLYDKTSEEPPHQTTEQETPKLIEPQPQIIPLPKEDSEITNIPIPEVRFPSAEIKVIQSDPIDVKIKEEFVKEEVKVASPVHVDDSVDNCQETDMEEVPVVESENQEIETPTVEPTPAVVNLEKDSDQLPASDQVIDESTHSDTVEEEEKHFTEENEPEPPQDTEQDEDKEDEPKIKEEKEQEEKTEEEESVTIPNESIPLPPAMDTSSIPLPEEKSEDEGKIELKEEPLEEKSEIKEEERQTDIEDTHADTDDDTPMELIREEDKGGRKRRDYSRRKTQPDTRTYSGSESAAETSAPESPMQDKADPEREHRLWKKSVMLVYSRLCAHKYASLFLRPITDEQAPGYSQMVKRPMDLQTIKRNIDQGVIRTTAEFQRDVLLMLSNSLMYNSTSHRVHQMAIDMHREAAAGLGLLLAAQAHAALEPPPRRSTPAHKRRLPTKRTHEQASN